MGAAFIFVGITCGATTESFATWPVGNSGTNVDGACIAGYGGSPTRACSLTGVYGSISNPCTRTVPKRPFCGLRNAAKVFLWGERAVPGGAAGGKRCRSWYAGNVCQASTFANATWPATNSGVNATGTCIDGYGSASSATRLCNLNGVFSSTVIAACQRTRRWLGPHSAALPREIGRAGDGRLVVRVTDVLGMGVARCAARPTPGQSIGLFCASVSSEQQASWPLTYSGDVAIGTCEAGWTGTPARTCSLTGVFGSISNPCTRTWDGRADCGRSACSCQQARCLTPALRASVRGGGGAGGRAGVP